MHALHQVLHSFFNLHSFTLAMPDVWAGFQVNLRMMAIAEVLVLVFALNIAIIRGLPGRAAKPLRALAIVYTDFFRGTPIIIVAFFVGSVNDPSGASCGSRAESSCSARGTSKVGPPCSSRSFSSGSLTAKTSTALSPMCQRERVTAAVTEARSRFH